MYRFQTNNGCSTCDAMEGLYDEAPARPHPYCRCIISVVDDDDTNLTAPTSGRPGGFDRTGDGWSWSFSDGPIYISDEDGDNYGETYTIPGTLSVECCDGVTVTGEDYDVVIHMDLSQASTREEAEEIQEAAFQEAESGLRTRAEELRDADCHPCDHIV